MCADPKFTTRSRRWESILLLATAAFLGVPRADAACQPTVVTLRPADGTSADFAGTAVAVSGDVAVIGAPGHGGYGRDAGGAYIFRRTGQTWAQEQQLIPSLLGTGDKFGQTVSASGDVVLVGARGQGDFGAVYVFRYNGSSWIEETVLAPSDGVYGDNFGYTVAVSGTVALIGAYGVDDFGTSSGAAYVFRYNGSRWSQEAKLHASDAAASDFFGVGVALDGNVAVVGAYLDDDLGTSSGSAYVFRYNGADWVAEGKLLANDGSADDRLGAALGISGNRIVAGVEQHDAYASNAGAAYVFSFDNARWSQEAKLFASDGDTNDRFGASVGISGTNIVVGAYGREAGDVTDAGAAYVYEFNGTTWDESNTLVAPDGWYWDYFGDAVAIDGGVTAVGSPEDDNNGNNSGSLYVFENPCAVSMCSSNADCDDGNECTDDICDPTVGCRFVDNTNACTPDGACTGEGVCNAGVCACVDQLLKFDLPGFIGCMRGPSRFAQNQCRDFDGNADNFIDLRDFGDLDVQ